MAFVIARARGRFEVRESRHTPAGPRARTLASFRVLTDDVLDRAAARSASGIDREALRRRAVALGAPVRDPREVARAARSLLAELRRGKAPPPALTSALRGALPRRLPQLADSLEDALEWVGATVFERGQTLIDLLALADALPPRRPPDTIAFLPLRDARRTS